MENSETNKKLFIISKNTNETTSIDYKDFFGETNRYLDNESKFILGNKNLIRIKMPQKLIKQNSNCSRNQLIVKNNKENNINQNSKSELSKTMNSLSKLKQYYYKQYKQKLKQKSASSLTMKTKEENKDENKDNTIDDKKNKHNINKIIFRNKSSLKENISNKFKKSLSFQQNIHYELKTKKEIIDLFEKYIKNRKEKNSDKSELLSEQKSAYSPKIKLSYHEIMKTDEENKKNFNIFSKFLMGKCKRNQRSLLVNKITNFNYKKYMSNFFDNNKIISEKFGNNYWLCNLKRSDIKNEKKINYVVTGKLDKEPWEQIIEVNHDHEFLSDPTITNTQIKNFNQTNEHKIFIKKYPHLKSFNNIKIEGKNLLVKEFTNFSNNTMNKNESIKYRLYKDPRELKNKNIKEIIYRQNYLPFSRSNKIFVKKMEKFKI